MNYLVTKIDIDGGAYQLYSDSSKTLKLLKAGFTYYLYIYASKYQMATFNLNMTSLTSYKPFSYVYVYEYSSKIFTNYLSSKYTSVTLSSKNNNVFSASFKYSNNKYDTQYIALKIIPSYDIVNLTAKITTEYNKYDLYEKSQKTIYNLKNGIKYYLFIDTSDKTKVKVTLKSSNYNYLSIDIYEVSSSYYNNIDDYYYSKTEHIDGNSNSFTYTTTDNSIKKIFLEISPSTDINYITAEFEYSFTLSGPMIFIIIISIIIIIIIIIYIYRKNRKSSNIFGNSTQSHPLYPTNNYNYQQQYNYSNQQQQYMPPQNQQNYQYQQQQYNQQQYNMPQQQYNLPQQQQYTIPQQQ
jgi:hypothetical protein